MTLQEMASFVMKVNAENGWFDKTRTFGEDVALLHSEVSEMLEAFREMDMVDTLEPSGKPIGVGSEAADILIRLLDTCYRYGIDLEKQFHIKMNYNKTRGYRHGGKAL